MEAKRNNAEQEKKEIENRDLNELQKKETEKKVILDNAKEERLAKEKN